MKNRFYSFLIILLLHIFGQNFLCAESPIRIHKTNFYLFSRQEQVFYPYGVNVGYLLSPAITPQEIEQQLTSLAVAGVNTLRIVLDDACPLGGSRKEFENADGTLTANMLARLDLLLETAKQHKMYVIPVLYDIETMAENWDRHPYNQKNGGACKEIGDFFTQDDRLQCALHRVDQLVNRYQKQNIFAWEVGRGINIFEMLDFLSKDLENQVKFWTIRMADQIRRVDEMHHLIAASFLPNTLPFNLMSIQTIHVLFLHIQSDNPDLSVQTIPRFIEMVRPLKKPVWFGEITWSGSPDQQETFVRDVLWSSVTAGSGAFLSAVKTQGKITVPSSHLSVLESLQKYLEHVELGGTPRPPAPTPIEITPKDSFLKVESLVGKDWLYRIQRKEPGKGRARLSFKTIEGDYEYLWFDPYAAKIVKILTFTIRNKSIQLESPIFERDLVGRLRYIKPLEKKPEADATTETMPEKT